MIRLVKTIIYWVRSKMAVVLFRLYVWIDPDTENNLDDEVYVVWEDLNSEQVRTGDQDP